MEYPAYLSGVLHGDAWCTGVLGLRVKDRDFAEAFEDAIGHVFGIFRLPTQDERGYWLVRMSNRTGRFDELHEFVPETPEQKTAWLRGLFDSEGNAQLRLNGISENSYGRRVAIYSTNIHTMEKARAYLTALGIATRLSSTKNSAMHKGRRTVYELSLKGGRTNYERFAEMIGSSIARKQVVLGAIPISYKPDRLAHCRAAQLKGAASKHRKTMEQTLPQVIAGIRLLMERGIKPTQRACSSILGYNTVKRYVPQAELVAMAERQ